MTSVAANGLFTALVLGWLLLMSMKAVSVDVTPHVAFAPARVVVTVHVQPNAQNRGLYVEADGQAYRSSFAQLDGEDAAIFHRFEWYGLGPGHYSITAFVSSASKVLATDHTTLQVLGDE